MIRAQRRRHVLMWAVLVPLMLAGLAAALFVRPARPVQPLPGSEHAAIEPGEATR